MSIDFKTFNELHFNKLFNLWLNMLLYYFVDIFSNYENYNPHLVQNEVNSVGEFVEISLKIPRTKIIFRVPSHRFLLLLKIPRMPKIILK